MMMKALFCAAALCLSAVAAPVAVSATNGLGAQAVVESVYGKPTKAVKLETVTIDKVPSDADLNNIGLRVKTTQQTLMISNILSPRGPIVFDNVGFNGVQIITLPDEVEFISAELQAVNAVYKTGLPNNNANEITQSAISFDAHHIWVNLAGFTILPQGDVLIKYRTKDVEVAPSSTGVAPPAPSTGGNVDPGDGGAVGDPQITGFLGQSFQVHGTAATVYSVISSAALQYNALFSFLSEGKCRAGTECFAHPGNYFGAVGMLIKQASGATTKIEVTAGPVAEGMKVTIDGEPLSISQSHIKIDEDNSLHFGSQFEMLLQTRDYTLRLQNSDMFLNQQVSIRAPLLEQIKSFKSKSTSDVSMLPHGILGQTWRRMSYPNRWVHLEGDLMNYIVADGLLGVPSEMNRFKSA